MLLTREPQPIALLGVGESSDAHHISAPHPQGEGAIRAITRRLTMPASPPGRWATSTCTAPPRRLTIGWSRRSCSSCSATPCRAAQPNTSPDILGAAGITEAAIGMLILQRHLPLPAQDFSLSPRDPALAECGIIATAQPLERPVILSNSFAFGGNNASILLGRVS